MKRIVFNILRFVVLASVTLGVSAANLNDESLTYKIKYKWGLIHKQAGHATVTLTNSGRDYIVQLAATSEPWVDKIYQVRDTLNGVIAKDGFRPQFYEKIAHEGKEDKHDTVLFEYLDSGVVGHCTRLAAKNGVVRDNYKQTLHAEGVTVDMLSAFYYMRWLPYQTWKPGHKEILTIFSGKKKETLTIEYHGVEDAKSDKKSHRCYHITFIFTSDGGKKSSDDMDAWITADDRRIPVRLEGKLPVGKVHCVYSGD